MPLADPKQLPIPFPIEKIDDFCRRWNVTNFALFGSVLRPDFRPDSDVDVLVTFSPEARPTLLTLSQMQFELEEIFRRRVDLAERGGVEQMRNPYYRREILGTAQVMHAR